MHMTTTQNNFTQVLYSMNHKSIISLISFFLLSMFYVASANAGPTYINVEVPKVCGAWKYNASRSHHCAGTGKGKDVSAGTKGTFRCVGGGNGRGNLMIEMENCPTVIWRTHSYGVLTTMHDVKLIKGDARRGKSGQYSFHLSADNTENTKHWYICPKKIKYEDWCR
jgi:hypothetical protein